MVKVLVHASTEQLTQHTRSLLRTPTNLQACNPTMRAAVTKADTDVSAPPPTDVFGADKQLLAMRACISLS